MMNLAHFGTRELLRSAAAPARPAVARHGEKRGQSQNFRKFFSASFANGGLTVATPDETISIQVETSASYVSPFEPCPKSTHTLQDLAALLALTLLIVLPNLGQTHYLANREIRHAEIIREMAESQDYVVPHLLGEVYYDKPPVMHAAAAMLTRWWGQPSMFLARFPSALAALGTVWVTYGLGRVMSGRAVALVGAAALLATPGFSIMARDARPDTILCFAIIGCCLALALGMKDSRRGIRAGWFTVAGAAAGLGVITKGPYGLLFPLVFAVLSPFRREDWKRPRLGWLGFAAALLGVAGLWVVPAYLQAGGHYLHDVIFQKDLNVFEHASSWYNLIAPAIFLSLPMIVFLPMAIRDWRRHGYSAPLACAAAIFVIVQAVPKKRSHYLEPMYPFLALGLAMTIVRHAAESKRTRRLAWAAMAIGLIITPLYFGVALRWIERGEDPALQVAREVLNAVKPAGQIYNATYLNEAMAWVGRDYRRLKEIDLADPHATAQLREAPAGSYILITQAQQARLQQSVGNLPLETVASFEWPKRRLSAIINHSNQQSREVIILRVGNGPSSFPNRESRRSRNLSLAVCR